MSPSTQQTLLVAAVGALAVAEGFQIPAQNSAHVVARQGALTSAAAGPLFAKKSKKGNAGGKGFGESKAPVAKQKPAVVETAEQSVAPPVPSTDYDSAADLANPVSFATTEPQMNTGQRALAKMRAERQSKKDEELRRIAEIRKMDAQVAEESAAIPERVAQRMGKRMLPFVGIPLFGGMGAFVAFWYFATYKGVEFEPVVVAATTIGMLAISLLGITYSVLSASWDDDREGGALGIDEFKKNVGSVTQGVKRSRENQLLRERMAGLPESEIEAAIRDLEMREAREMKRSETLKEKMEKELS